MYEDSEPAVTDSRLEPIMDKVRVRYFPWLEETDFATARIVNPLGVNEVHFVVAEPYPKEPQRSLGLQLIHLGRTTAKDWDDYEQERKHYTDGRPDLVEILFMALGKQHMEAKRSLLELITDDIDRASPFARLN